MADPVQTKSQKLTREQIAAMVGKNPRAIKLWENLLSDVQTTLPDAAASAQTTADNAATAAGAAQTTANNAQTAAGNAQTSANSAQTDATSALTQLNTFSAIPFLTLATSAALTSERVLTAGAGISFVDAGAGGALTVSLTPDTVLKDSLGNTVVQVAATSKLGLFGATPAAQPTTAGASATFVAGAGTAVNDASTFDGYTLKQVVKALRTLGILA